MHINFVFYPDSGSQSSSRVYGIYQTVEETNTKLGEAFGKCAILFTIMCLFSPILSPISYAIFHVPTPNQWQLPMPFKYIKMSFFCFSWFYFRFNLFFQHALSNWYKFRILYGNFPSKFLSLCLRILGLRILIALHFVVLVCGHFQNRFVGNCGWLEFQSFRATWREIEKRANVKNCTIFTRFCRFAQRYAEVLPIYFLFCNFLIFDNFFTVWNESF